MLDTMLSYVSWSGITYLAIVLILARWGVLMVIQDRKIRQLGGYAAKRPHRTPFGMQFENRNTVTAAHSDVQA